MAMRNKTARQHNFATVPRADIPRSKFAMHQTRKMAFDASELVPIMCEEVLPGDIWRHQEATLARLATPIAPVIDDIDLETFYFFMPNRVSWPKWEDFITGANNALSIPTLTIGSDANTVGTLHDHFGIPLRAYAPALPVSVLPYWAYFTIWNEWFRDQNLQEPWIWASNWTSGGRLQITQDTVGWDANPLRINKRHDYFTSSLPWPQKGDAVELPLGTSAPVVPEAAMSAPTFNVAGSARTLQVNTATPVNISGAAPGGIDTLEWEDPKLIADLSTATAVTINAIRLAFQTQKLLERDARGGSRYVEQILSHFGVRSPDYRLQRPEYLGGSKIPITVNPIAQTAAYDAEPASAASAIGNLGAEMHAQGNKRTFTYAATEHGYIIGLAAVRATPTYQQGIRRHWSRTTRLDFYFPVFAELGEQAVLTKEIFATTNGSHTNETWGYQERWAEYRYTPNEITGVLRSAAPQPLDWWHYAEQFASEPALNAAFMYDKTQETLARSLATAPSAQWSAQIIMDITHHSEVARLMPVYSVPGHIDHF